MKRDHRERWTPLGVRLRRRAEHPGHLDWLLLPGGPGIGSESLIGLSDGCQLPGRTWLVDLPGDGSNVDAPGAPSNPYQLWPHVLVEAAHAVAHPVFVGHSTGGMYLLSVPALEGQIEGLALISSAPDAGWIPAYESMIKRHALPEATAAAERFDEQPTAARLCELAVASAPWNFTSRGLPQGRQLLARMPYNPDAVEWSAGNFDSTYVSSWWPSALPTLIVSGGADRVVDQSLWDDRYYQGSNVLHRTIAGGGHFPWIEQPTDVRLAFDELADLITSPAAACATRFAPPAVRR